MNHENTDSTAQRITPDQLNHWLQFQIQKMLKHYAQHWIDEKITENGPASTIDVTRLVSSILRYSNGMGFDVSEPSTMDIFASAMQSLFDKQWIVQDVRDTSIENSSWDDQIKIRTCWFRTRPTPASFLQDIVEKYFPTECKSSLGPLLQVKILGLSSAH